VSLHSENRSNDSKERFAMDPVTDAFQSLQIASVLQARLEVSAPWGLKRESPATAEAGRSAVRSSSPFAHFGMLTHGHCWLSAEGVAEAIPLSSGDCFLFAPGSPYALRDHPKTGTLSFCSVASEKRSQIIEYGGGGARSTILYGWFRFCASSQKPLARLLPPLILVRADQPQSLALRTTIDMLTAERAKPALGSELVVQRLVDILFVQCIRAHIESRAGADHKGLLRALLDPQIGVALKLMQEKVEAPWTVETLAKACGMSRTAFALRFKALVGETPLEYLTTWRMQKAAALLQKGDKKVSEVARLVGYDSESAFSKAFKRVVQVAPRPFRQRSFAWRAHGESAD
jgi:AraC-like DNA-binding protein